MTAIADPAARVYARLRIRAALWELSRTALLAGIFCVSVVAQTTKLSFTHLSAADGLSNADVRAIVQDRQGFMWFGTWLGGLNRYDGYTFKVYRHDDQEYRSLGCDSIWALYLDRAGVLWVGTNDGVDRYDRDTDSFVHYRHRADDPNGLPGYWARSFNEDESGTLWVGSSGGLSRFDRTSGRFLSYGRGPNDPTSFGDTDVRSIWRETTTGLLWVSTWGEGVSALDRSTGHSTRYKNNPNDPGSLSNNNVAHVFQDREGSLWFSTLHGLNRFDPKAHTFLRYLHDPGNPASLSDDYVTMTYEDHSGRFWVATNNGLNLMDRSRGTFTPYLHDPNDFSGLSSNVINWGALYEDASGALWLGMRSTGVDRLIGGAERFTTYRNNPQDAKSPGNNVITALVIGSAGALWIGTEGGLDRFDGQTFIHYISSPNNPSRLSPGPERMVAQDSRGAVWTGTYGGGLDRLDGHHVTHFRHDPKNPDSPANNNISSLVPDAQGGLWIGVHGDGLDYFDGRHFTHFPPNPGDPAGLPEAYLRPLLLDPRGTLWIVTARWGLVRFDTHTRKFTAYLLDPNQPGNQAMNFTEDIYSDGTSIWVASPTNGLFRFDPETGKFTRHYTERDGLANNSVAGILGDDQGNVWVSTAKGLSRFDPRTETFRNYDMFDGLQGNEFSLHCRAEAPDGRLFFGGANGLSALYPDKLVDNPIPPTVVLTDFELFNKPVKIGGKDSPLRQAINVASIITLRYDQSVFRFQFATLDFTAPQKNRYAYKLDRFDRDWQYTDATRRFATYTHLDPGDYTFRVKASNNDGVWNEQGVALHVRILPPWWNTLWFRALALASILLSIWCAYQLRVRRLQREFHAQLDGRVDERMRIARELHDTLLQSVQGLMFLFQAARNLLPGRTEEAIRTLDKAIREGDEAIAEGRDAIQGLRVNPAVDSNLEHLLTVAGKDLARSLGAEAEPPAFQVTVEGARQPLSPLLQDEVYRIAREFLRNAFRHAHATRIEAEIAYDSQFFRLRIRDNGKGIERKVMEAGARQEHWGLPGVSERAKRIGARVKLWSEPGAGTEAELTVPASVAYAASHVRRRFGLFPIKTKTS